MSEFKTTEEEIAYHIWHEQGYKRGYDDAHRTNKGNIERERNRVLDELLDGIEWYTYNMDIRD